MSKQLWKKTALGLVWFLALLWPLLGIHADGTLSFIPTFKVWGIVAMAIGAIVVLMSLRNGGAFDGLRQPSNAIQKGIKAATKRLPMPAWIAVALVAAIIFPQVTNRVSHDVAINVMVYICLGLGLNIVVGLAGMLDLGYIAFYGVGAYTYALMSLHYHVSFWLCLPVAAATACLAGCIIGYPTLRMRGDYLAIVTLGFGEIVRLILNNWMDLTNGPNGILGVPRPTFLMPTFEDGFGFELITLRKLHLIYYVILGLAIITIIAVRHLNYSRIGRAWEAIREDETAAELMGVNTFKLKLLAYGMGALFGGIAGAFFSARNGFVSPESFTFLESAMVLAMVVLGGMASIPGVVVGALALIVLPEVFREFELYRMLCLGGAMVLMMNFRPEGLIPASRVGTRGEEKE